ncbi:hypothetical protein MHI37_01235 [Paenibacillus sp. FSL H8-0548]|uniref:hypothetical protein n=1 Tax=Paenibacillus sp. FSL H8-0548 TaxID=1920422 RepID=UPI001180DA36|nr:hypothetical protein [Paenibacillus sp. FSL H8-0548]
MQNLNTEDAKKIRRNIMVHHSLQSKYNEGYSFTTETEKKLLEGGFIETIHGATVLSEVRT